MHRTIEESLLVIILLSYNLNCSIVITRIPFCASKRVKIQAKPMYSC